MKFNDNRGITLISLAIATLVIIVISGAIIFNTRNQISLRDINYLYQDIQAINGRIDDYYVKYGELPILCDYLNKDELVNYIHTKSESLGVSIGGGLITNPNDNDNYYVIDLEKLGGLSLNYGYDIDYQTVKENGTVTEGSAETKIYVINEKTHQVYFPHGIIADSLMYVTYKIVNDIPQIVEPAKRKTQMEVGDYVNYTYDSTASTYSLPRTVSGYTGDVGNVNYNEVSSPRELTGQDTINRVENLKWRILTIYEDGSIDLVSDGMGSQNNFFFQGSLGYNNGVCILNDIAKTLYSNSRLGSKAIARSMNIDDIERHYTNEAINARNSNVWTNGSGTYTSPVYGGNGATASKADSQQTMTGTKYYPKLYEQEKYSGVNPLGTKDQSDPVYESPTSDTYIKTTTGLTVTRTAYGWNNTPETYISNQILDSQASIIGQDENSAYNLIFGTGKSYFVASRAVDCQASYLFFQLRTVTAGNLSATSMFNSGGGDGYAYGRFLRPVIHLDKSLKYIVKSGTEENMHKIVVE